ncbi:MAG: hypothetical protein A2788_00090 [Candidatus Abawacabacteria bacterium RIFCSPHIGHO2_01_FULL_46_8]|uniref:Glutaredoxin domain-containing protein n=1 Tax=Candidatus Abawacabacteria bacterium RIFCSPHIGHO2_01_FULL_46_8 TaxID=1817815 RepID=A0A1F4XKT1_9BACT|nr:MAG: hypothetical protein A2788_00090 [Candidatus Abawacabacteria bacterium RIFCSPHIGHO2_01_FULL_46_8]
MAGANPGATKIIKIYTSPTCGFCHMLKEYLDDNKVEYQQVDVSTDTAALEQMIKVSEQSGVPVTMIWDKSKQGKEAEGEPLVIVGFDKAKLDEVLGTDGE